MSVCVCSCVHAHMCEGELACRALEMLNLLIDFAQICLPQLKSSLVGDAAN